MKYAAALEDFAALMSSSPWPFIIVAVLAIVGITCCIAIPLTSRFERNRAAVWPHPALDPEVNARELQLLAEIEAERERTALAHAGLALQKKDHDRQLAIAWEHSGKLQQRALRHARSNRMARAVIAWELGMDAAAVRRRARQIGAI